MIPALAFLPEVDPPDNRLIPFITRALRTGAILLIYLVCCQIPIYGVTKIVGGGPFYWMHAILASNRGTIMELGFSPIVTSGMIMQLLAERKKKIFFMIKNQERKTLETPLPFDIF